MRRLQLLVGLVFAVVAGALIAFAVAGARWDALIHTPEPLQKIAGPVAALDSVQQTLPVAVGDAVREQVPDVLPGGVEDAMAALARGAADGLISDEEFEAAWGDAVEQTRTGWLAKLDRQRTEEAPGRELAADAATVELQIGPIADLAQTRLEEGVQELPFGDLAVRALRDAVGSGHQIAVDLNVPSADLVAPAHVLWLEEHSRLWPGLAVGAGICMVLGVALAPAGRRWMTLVAAGAVAIAVGMVGRMGLQGLGATGTTGAAHAVAQGLIQGVQNYALPDTTVIMVAGAVLAVIGGLGGLLRGWVSARSGTGHTPSSQ